MYVVQSSTIHVFLKSHPVNILLHVPTVRKKTTKNIE